jgi:hypothetical protein
MCLPDFARAVKPRGEAKSIQLRFVRDGRQFTAVPWLCKPGCVNEDVFFGAQIE